MSEGAGSLWPEWQIALDQEATVRTGNGTTDWFQIGKGVRQGCMISSGATGFQLILQRSVALLASLSQGI